MSYFPNVEKVELFPEPEPRTGGNSTRPGQATLEGGSYKLLRPVDFNRIIIRVTSFSAPATLRLMLFQKPTGFGANATPATRVATVTGFSPGGTGNFQLTPSEGAVRLSEGVFYLLFGNDAGAGTVTLRTYSVLNLDLIVSNVELDTHCTNYSTAIASTTTPATFDPRPVATGEATPSTADLTPIIRFVMV